MKTSSRDHTPKTTSRTTRPFFSKESKETFFSPQAQEPKLFFQASGLQTQRASCQGEDQIHMKDEDEAHESEEKSVEKTFSPPPDDQIMRSSDTPAPQLGSGMETRLLSAKGKGSPLPESSRSEMEAGLGADFSRVRIHTSPEAADMNTKLQAKAFTHGSDIFFSKGNFDPSSQSGKKLLAHELTHTLQQAKGVEYIQKYDHTVSQGENPTTIARRYGISVQDLTTANPTIPASGLVQPGQVLNIPIREHRVVSGEFLGPIARRYGVTVESIQRANGLTGTTIQNGQILAIPGLRVAPASAPSSAPTSAPASAPSASQANSLVASNPPEILSSTQLRNFRYSRGLIRTLDTWTSSTIRTYLSRLRRPDLAQDRRSSYESRISSLVQFRINLRTNLSANLSQGDDLLTLANIIYNEAGNFGPAAHRAVAYAWLNRTGGTVSANRGAALSGYVRLSVRWTGYTTMGQRLTFISNFPRSLDAASRALNDRSRGSSDPTGRATHWVSPQGLPVYNPRDPAHRRDRYPRTYGRHANRAFPNWAVANSDTARITRLRGAGQIDSTYREITVRGIPGEQFLFYRGVRFSR